MPVGDVGDGGGSCPCLMSGGMGGGATLQCDLSHDACDVLRPPPPPSPLDRETPVKNITATTFAGGKKNNILMPISFKQTD